MKPRLPGKIRRKRIEALVAAVVAGAALAVPGVEAAARPRAESLLLQVEEAEHLDSFPAQRGARISLAQATSIAQSRFRGRVVRAETVRIGDRVVHEIRILGEDERTVRTVRIDAETGAFL